MAWNKYIHRNGIAPRIYDFWRVNYFLSGRGATWSCKDLANNQRKASIVAVPTLRTCERKYN
jgi:hypothetical protein